VIYHVDQEVPWVLRRGAGRFLAAADYVKPHHSLAAPRAIAYLSRLENRPAVPWTIDDIDLAEALLERRAAGIITNRPQDYPRK
jgi:glycerophosphoryl diester phosphodiesterase